MFSVPAGAVVNSTTGAAGTNQLYAQSVFPFTVGFVYDDINEDGRYIMSTPLGHWGVENNKTLDGVDEFDFSNILTSNIGGGTDTGTISYTFGDVVWPEVQHYVVDSSGYKYRGGYYDMNLAAEVPEFFNNVTSILFRARDIYYNPVWNNKLFSTDYGYGPKNFMIPTFTLPELYDYTTQAFVGTYSVDATIIDGRGVAHDVAYSVPIDTRTDGNVPIMFINRESLAPYVSYSETGNDIKSSSNDTIIISDFTGYLDVDYYEITPEVASSFNIYDASTYIGSFDFVEGMTWREFVNSIYNPDYEYLPMYKRFYIADNSNTATVFFNDYGSGFSVRLSDLGNQVTAGDQIINGYSYNIHSGDIGGANDPGMEGPSASNDFDWGAALDDGYSASTYDVTPSATGEWKPVDKFVVKSNINVTVPMYDTSRATAEKGSTEWRMWSLPVASKYIKTTDLYQIINESIVKDYTSWLAEATGGFLDAEIFPGFTIGGVMGTLIAFSVVMLFLKLFAGG